MRRTVQMELDLPPSPLEAPSAFVRDAVSILSPLRYPGSKRRLAGYIENTLRRNKLRPALFVEPFAGGASVALQLLNNKSVETIGLIDRDPLVASFWKTVFRDAEWLIKQIEDIDVTLERFYALKASQSTLTRDQALKCLFLNRTSFSGILTPQAGPIGGKEQLSQYKVDCRFTKPNIIKRIEKAASLADKVAFVWNTTYNTGINRLRVLQQNGELPADVFYYFDPPFFEKADELYTYYFTDRQHVFLRNFILALQDSYILSYDNAKRFYELYKNAGIDPEHVELLYSTSGPGGSRTAQEIVFTNISDLPPEKRLWRRNTEWKAPKSKCADMEPQKVVSVEASYSSDTFPTLSVNFDRETGHVVEAL